MVETNLYPSMHPGTTYVQAWEGIFDVCARCLNHNLIHSLGRTLNLQPKLCIHIDLPSSIDSCDGITIIKTRDIPGGQLSYMYIILLQTDS